MGCIDEMKYEILLSNTSFKEAAEYIKKNWKEIYFVKPGYRLFDIYLIGIPPIPVAVEKENLIIPYIKPCHGTFVIRIPADNETEKLKKAATPR